MEFWFLGFVLGQGFGLFFDTLVGCLPYLLGGSFFVLLHFYPLLAKGRLWCCFFGILFGGSTNAPSPSQGLQAVRVFREDNLLGKQRYAIVENQGDFFLSRGVVVGFLREA